MAKLGKHERLKAKQAALMAANLSRPKPVQELRGKGWRQGWKGQSVTHKESTKVATHHIGFVGPRGFKSETHIRPVETPLKAGLGSRRPTVTGKVSKRFNKDGF